ncbi:MAG TPA: YdeI/OmpD-associated family protein [Anaerolineaceae bacterium]
MKLSNTLYAKDLPEWHAWLELNYASVKEVWLVYYKVHTGQPCIDYEDSVEEALCFGWIDSLVQRIDEASYARKFTPRTNTAKWSESNKCRVAKLIREGRMTQAGLAKLGDLPADGIEPPTPEPRPFRLPPEVETLIRANPVAWGNFNKLPPSQRRLYIGWATSAKKAETVTRRMKEVIEDLEQNKPLGMK